MNSPIHIFISSYKSFCGISFCSVRFCFVLEINQIPASGRFFHRAISREDAHSYYSLLDVNEFIHRLVEQTPNY